MVSIEPAVGRKPRRRARRAVSRPVRAPWRPRPASSTDLTASPRRTTLPSTTSRFSAGCCSSSAANSMAFVRTSAAASRVASPVITVTRDANAPCPKSMRSVWPWTTRTRAIVDAERVGADLRDDRLDPLPDRGRAGHHLDEAGGVDRDPHAVERPEPALLDENRKPRPDAFAAGATPLQFLLQLGPLDRPPAPCRAAAHSRRNRAPPAVPSVASGRV